MFSSDRELGSQSLPIALIEYLRPTVKFAPAFANLLQATHRLTTIRITRALQGDWVDSLLLDYPRVYVRVILELFDGLSRVKSIPPLVTLELCDCPFVNIKDSGRVDKAIASRAIGKITRLKVTSPEQGLESYERFPPYRRGFKEDLLAVFQNAYHLKGLCLHTGHDKIFKDFINSPNQFEHLVQVQFCVLYTEASVFGPFIAKKLPQLEMLIIGEGHINEPGSWTEVFEVWRRMKAGMVARGQPLKLVVFRLGLLFDGVDQVVPLLERVTITYELCAAQLAASFVHPYPFKHYIDHACGQQADQFLTYEELFEVLKTVATTVAAAGYRPPSLTGERV
jgi:hypothetical protein